MASANNAKKGANVRLKRKELSLIHISPRKGRSRSQALLEAEGIGVKAGVIPAPGHDLGAVLQDGYGMLEVSSQTAVLGLDRCV